MAAKKVREDSMIAKLLNFFNRWLYKHASKIIVVGRDMQKLLEAKTQRLDIPIATIPNWAELETVRPADRNQNELLKDLFLTEKFVFLYAGNMGYPNDIETIVSAAKKLKGNSSIHFIFLGAGVKETWLRRTSCEQNLTSITILKPKPRSEQLVFLNACDVALVSLVRKMRGVSMPSRTYNILAAGKPILAICEEETELATVIGEEDVGWTVPPGEPELLYAKILEIYEQRQNFCEIGFRARRAAVTKYSVETALSWYRSELL